MPKSVHACGICPNRYFTRKDSLRRHLRAHAAGTAVGVSKGEAADSTKYVCKHCGRTFDGISLYQIHVRSHRGETAPHFCPVCRKVFVCRNAMIRHKRTMHGHTRIIETEAATVVSEIPTRKKKSINTTLKYVSSKKSQNDFYFFMFCLICYRISELCSADDYNSNTSSSSSFPCPQCGECFDREYSLRSHVFTLHASVAAHHACRTCAGTFESEEALIRHRVEKHAEEIVNKCQVWIRII